VSRQLVRTVGLPQAVAPYAGAVFGAGVLLLPGMAASLAGPAAILAWGFDTLLGALLAGAFAALPVRMPEPGGVATYTAWAFGGAAGARRAAHPGHRHAHHAPGRLAVHRPRPRSSAADRAGRHSLSLAAPTPRARII
jgi:amino acid transporter